MGKGSGGGTNTVTNNSSPPPEVMAQYQKLLAQGNSLASQPLQQYGGPMIAGFTPDQNQAFQTVDNAQGISAPYLGQAQNLLNNSQSNLWNGTQQYSPDAINKYYNPYQTDVVNSTMANINETNAQQNQQVVGNAISKGAWGGDRAGIAQAELARQQGLASNQTLAGLQQQGFTGAQGEFNQQQGAQLGANTTNNWLASQGAFGEANLGNQAQSNALQGAAAQLATGQQQQTLAQSALNIPYEQFQQQQAYPYQNLSWLSGISTGLGSGMGGSSSSTQPAPNQSSQMLGTLGGLGQLGYLGYLAFSDKRIKENLDRMGVHHGRYGSYPMYDFNYKGDSKTYRGVMAQDVERVNPWAVGENEHGIKYVDYSKLARGGAANPRGFAPPAFDSGGGIPDVNMSYIPSIQMVHGSGIPNAPQPYKPEQNNDVSTAVGGIANLMKMDKMNQKDSMNPLGLSSSSDFSASDINKIAGDFSASGGGFSPGEFAGGFADGGAPDDLDSSYSMPGPSSDPSAQPQGFVPGNFGTPPKFDGAGAAPINKPDALSSLFTGLSAMGASQSPYFGVNAGHAGQVAGADYQKQKEEAAKESYQQGSLQQQGEHLYDQANLERQKMYADTQHQKATEKQAADTLSETSKYHSGELALRKEQIEQDSVKVIPDGMGGFLQYNTKDPDSARVIKGAAQVPPPLDDNGKPLTGPAYADYLKTNNPQLASAAQMLVDGDKKMPSLTSRSDPMWKQAVLAARNIDPTFNEERFVNKQKFDADAKGMTDSFNTIPSHLKVLEDAAHAIDNGDVRALNTIKNTWLQQTGSPLPTNLDTARNMVSAEIVKAITGAGGVTDRQDAQAQFDKAASDGQLTGAVGLTKHLIAERVQSVGNRYATTVLGKPGGGADDYVKRYIRPDVAQYLGLSNTGGAAPSGAATAPGANDIAYLKANPGKAAHFDAQFGAGASAKYLGSQGFD